MLHWSIGVDVQGWMRICGSYICFIVKLLLSCVHLPFFFFFFLFFFCFWGALGDAKDGDGSLLVLEGVVWDVLQLYHMKRDSSLSYVGDLEGEEYSYFCRSGEISY